jgi:hypothetical protein
MINISLRKRVIVPMQVLEQRDSVLSVREAILQFDKDSEKSHAVEITKLVI